MTESPWGAGDGAKFAAIVLLNETPMVAVSMGEQKMPKYLATGDAVREIARQRGVKISRRILTTLVYRRALNCETPAFGRLRMIPLASLPEFLVTLESRGYLTLAGKAVRHA